MQVTLITSYPNIQHITTDNMTAKEDTIFEPQRIITKIKYINSRIKFKFSHTREYQY
jgi:hypothetical protein